MDTKDYTGVTPLGDTAKGMPPILLAEQSGNKEIAELLRKAGAK